MKWSTSRSLDLEAADPGGGLLHFHQIGRDDFPRFDPARAGRGTGQTHGPPLRCGHARGSNKSARGCSSWDAPAAIRAEGVGIPLIVDQVEMAGRDRGRATWACSFVAAAAVAAA